MTVATRSARTAARASTSYQDDFYTWTQEQAACLRAGGWAALDRDNLAEEIASLGRSEFNSLVGVSRVILLHMLKFDHQPSRATHSWAISIATQRADAEYILKDNPGLMSRLDEALERAYWGARLKASQETRLPLGRFPETCPYTREALLARSFPIDPEA